MNPCYNCPLNKIEEDCHRLHYDNLCPDWIQWKTELIIFKGKAKLQNEQTIKKLENM